MKNIEKYCFEILCYILLILIISYIFIVLYNKFFNKKENFSNEYKFKLYYANWCPHCKDIIKLDKKEKDKDWDKLSKYLKNNKINNNNIECESIDCAKNKNRCKKIKGYPTIKLYKNNKEIDYNGKRNYDSFISFLKSECS